MSVYSNLPVGIKVVRVWKRDGTRNGMDLGIAVENIFRNGTPKRKCDEISAMLMRGETLETKHAEFYLHKKAGF